MRPPLRSRGVIAAAVILAVALVLRVGFVQSQDGYVPSADAGDFDRHAVSLAIDGRYPPSEIGTRGGPSAFRPPAYPYVLAGLYALTGSADATGRYELARLFSALLGVAAVALIGIVALQIWGSLVALVSMGLAALYPPLVTIGTSMLSEPLFIVLLLAALVGVLEARRSHHPLRWVIVAGLLAGALALTRTNGAIVIPILAIGLWPRPLLARASLTRVAAFLAMVVLVMAPWAIRNTNSFDTFVPVSTQTGFTLAGTYNQVSRDDESRPAAWRAPTMPPYAALLKSKDLNEAALEEHFRSLAVSYAQEHPSYILEAGFWNTVRMLGLQGPDLERQAAPEGGIGETTSDIDVYSFYLLAAASVISLLVGAARRAPWFIWALPVLLGFSLIFVIAYMRYRLPIDPFLIMLTAAGLLKLATIAGERAERKAAPADAS